MIKEKQELELYVHIPFCVRKCNYCDFLSFSASREEIAAYCRALEEEIRKTAEYLSMTEASPEGEAFSPKKIRSIFFGGGTPSLLSPGQMESLMSCIRDCFPWEEGTEITLEANPGTLDREKLSALRQAGINRLSIGLQSTKDECLKLLGRIHTWEQFLRNYEEARKTGFSNINIDLMSGLPGQSLSIYEETLEEVAALHPEHISAYSLILEEGTPFYASAELRNRLPDEETERRMYERTKEILLAHGYKRYEISNYAKAGRECIHNLGYWDNIPYLGFGLGASSYYNRARFSNEGNLPSYLEQPFRPFSEREEYFILSQTDEMEDYMIFGLRKMSGVSISEFTRRFTIPMEEIYGTAINTYEKMGLLERTGNRLRLTDAGIDVSNRIFEEFLLTE
ncbi:MAG: radical SAM family heme chaperone HemW [Eubacteriales bacterium]|nr:radical SAM family heme chaperone HemW [Eubacteriales bacterium]